MKLATVDTGGDGIHAPARRSYEKAGYTALPLVRYYKKWFGAVRTAILKRRQRSITISHCYELPARSGLPTLHLSQVSCCAGAREA